LWAWYYGLRIRPAVLITFAAALTALLNPFYVWGDLGWYLSFLAFFGIMVIAPAVSARLFSRPPKMLTAVVLETLSAEIMTLPLIMLSFSQLSLIALVANALVVPLVPFAMLLSAVAAGAGAAIPQLAGWLAWPARLLLTYILDVVHLLANIPSIFIHRSISLGYMLLLYGLVLAVVAVMRHRVSNRSELIEELAQFTP
jgi:competence protein ComEC